MNSDTRKRCPHYQIYSEPLQLEGPPAFLAIRRCMLAERLLHFLNQSEEGKHLGEKMVIHTTAGKRYAFVGTDLEPVTPQTCNLGRCEERCTPAYVRTLQHFGKVDPQADDVTCTESDEDEETKPGARIPTALPS